MTTSSTPTATNTTNHLPVGVIYQRLEHLEAQLTVVQGFIQKLFGSNFEEYCRSNLQSKFHGHAPKSNRYDYESSPRNSPLVKQNVSKSNNNQEHPQQEEEQEVEILSQVEVESCKEGHEDVVICGKKPAQFTINGSATITPIIATPISSSTIVHEQLNQEDFHHSSDTFVNPFLVEAGEENDPIAIDGEVEDNLPPDGNIEDGNSHGSVSIIPSSEATAEPETQSSSNYQDSDRLFFFDDGVNQQQFAEYFEEEDAEPFDALDEERDVKVLDVTEANYDSAATSVAELRSYHNMEADIKAIKIKSEHGKSLNSDDNNINENGSGSSGSGDPSRSKRRAVSLPSSSGSSTSKRGRGRPPKSGRIPVEKEDKRQSSDEDSDFKLESGEENAAEFSSSSSSDDNDPDWKGSHKLQSSSYQHHPQNKIGSMGGGPYRSRRGRPPNSLKNGRIPPNLVPLLPKAPTSLPGKFHPNGPIVLNLTSSPTCTMIPLPVNRFEVPYHRQKGRPRKTNPPQHLLHTTKTNPLQQNLPHNPIAQLPKVINGVYFRLISITADKRQRNLMMVKAKCAMCDAAGSQPVIVNGFGRSESSFYEHFMNFHPAEYLHYRTNLQNIDAATLKLRQVISKVQSNSESNNEAIFISQHLRRITSLDFVPS